MATDAPILTTGYHGLAPLGGGMRMSRCWMEHPVYGEKSTFDKPGAEGNETILYPSTNTLNSRAVDHTLDLANAYSFLNSKF